MLRGRNIPTVFTEHLGDQWGIMSESKWDKKKDKLYRALQVLMRNLGFTVGEIGTIGGIWPENWHNLFLKGCLDVSWRVHCMRAKVGTVKPIGGCCKHPEGGCLDPGDSSRKSERKSDKWYILKTVLAAFAGKLEVVCENHKRIKVLNWAIKRIELFL